MGPLRQSQRGKDVPPPQKVTVHPAPVLSSARQNRARWLQYKLRRMGLLARSRHAAGFILNQLCCEAGGAGDLDAQLQDRPSGTPPASATAFFPLPSDKALLYLLRLLLPRVWGTTCSVCDQPRPGPAQPDPDRAQQAPLAGARHRPHPAPSAVQQGPLLQPSRDGSVGHSARSGQQRPMLGCPAAGRLEAEPPTRLPKSLHWGVRGQGTDGLLHKPEQAALCPVLPPLTPEAASLQGKPPATGREEEQRKCRQQAVKFSQQATHIQSSQGLGLIHHCTTHTGALLWVLLLRRTYFQHAHQVCSLDV